MVLVKSEVIIKLELGQYMNIHRRFLVRVSKSRRIEEAEVYIRKAIENIDRRVLKNILYRTKSGLYERPLLLWELYAEVELHLGMNCWIRWGDFEELFISIAEEMLSGE